VCSFRHVGRSIAICNCPAGFTGGKCEVPVVNVTAGKWNDVTYYIIIYNHYFVQYYILCCTHNAWMFETPPWTSRRTRNNSYDICLEFVCVCLFFRCCKSGNNSNNILWREYNIILYYTAVLSKNRITAFFVKMKMAAYPTCNI